MHTHTSVGSPLLKQAIHISQLQDPNPSLSVFINPSPHSPDPCPPLQSEDCGRSSAHVLADSASAQRTFLGPTMPFPESDATLDLGKPSQPAWGSTTFSLHNNNFHTCATKCRRFIPGLFALVSANLSKEDSLNPTALPAYPP